ncbi:MAG: porin family protein [Prevotella sp.]|nr:porin family protein [Prevotella sp.]
MKKFFTTMVVALTLMALPAQAQLGLGWGLRGGLNLVSMSSDESTFDSSNRAGWFFGPTAKFTIPLIGIGLDVSALYDQRTSEFEGQSVKEQNVFIPINLRYQVGLGSVASAFVKAGPQFGWNIGSKTYAAVKDGNTGEFKLKDSNTSINLGVGINALSHLEVGINYNIVLGKTGDLTVKDAATNAYNNSKSRTNAWQLNVAYFF